MSSRKAKRKQKLVPADEPALQPSSQRSNWWLHALLVVFLLIANFALYQRTSNLGFLSVDDPDYVQNNPYIEKLDAPKLKFILTQPYAANYAPANILSYAVDVAIAGGKKASAIHLSSVMWHGWVVGMVYLLAFVIRPNVLTAAAAALLFMLHPAHVEVVAWISSRKDLVATGFAVLSMACYLLARKSCRLKESPESKAAEDGRTPKSGGKSSVTKRTAASYPDTSECRFGLRAWVWYVASVLSFLIASAGKQSVILLPAVMLVCDLLVEKRRSWQMTADKIPFGLITIFFGWMTWRAQPSTNQSPDLFTLAATELTNLWLLTGLGKYVVYRLAPDPAQWRLVGRILIILAAVAVWFLPLLLLWRPKRIGDPKSSINRCSSRIRIGVALWYWILLQMIPPMVLSFMVPITDRYLFLPSVGVCLLLAVVASSPPRSPSKEEEKGITGDPALASKKTRTIRLAPFALPFLFALIWSSKTWNYVGEWCDPRSVWYGAHLKTKSSQVSQFLGEIYQNGGDRVDAFIKNGTPIQVTNDLPMAQAVLADKSRAAALEDEWNRKGTSRTNSVAYRDTLWSLAWQEYQESATHRGKLSAPNLYMNRGRLLVNEGKFTQAIPEFQIALNFAQTSTYIVIRQETVIQALRAIGTCYWHMRNYKEGVPWFLKAQDVQRKSGKAWVATLDHEVEQIKAMAASQP